MALDLNHIVFDDEWRALFSLNGPLTKARDCGPGPWNILFTSPLLCIAQSQQSFFHRFGRHVRLLGEKKRGPMVANGKARVDAKASSFMAMLKGRSHSM